MTNSTDKLYKPLVYICSPYSGDTEANLAKVRSFCRFSLDQGSIPLAPHLMFPLFMNDTDLVERELAIFMDVILLDKCSKLWVLGDTVFVGMQTEIEVARRRRQPLRYFNSSFQEVTSL